MESSGWLATEINLENMTTHFDQGNPLKPYSFATYPDGALKTTTLDYSKFLIAIMNGGVYKGQRILEESTVKEMLPENPEENLIWENDVLNEFYVINTNDQHIQGHSGGDAGVFSVVYFNPENDRGVVLFANSTPSLLGFRVFNIISIINRLGREAQLY
jgi:CubicO group peptidase (beta-lactamase class C family)